MGEYIPCPRILCWNRHLLDFWTDGLPFCGLKAWMSTLLPILTTELWRPPHTLYPHTHCKGQSTIVLSNSLTLTCSKTACRWPIFIPGTTPAPPTSPAQILPTILPYKLGMTMTSNCWGLLTNYTQSQTQTDHQNRKIRCTGSRPACRCCQLSLSWIQFLGTYQRLLDNNQGTCHQLVSYELVS